MKQNVTVALSATLVTPHPTPCGRHLPLKGKARLAHNSSKSREAGMNIKKSLPPFLSVFRHRIHTPSYRRIAGSRPMPERDNSNFRCATHFPCPPPSCLPLEGALCAGVQWTPRQVSAKLTDEVALQMKQTVSIALTQHRSTSSLARHTFPQPSPMGRGDRRRRWVRSTTDEVNRYGCISATSPNLIRRPAGATFPRGEG